jgi:phosphatidylinositol glycan class B
VSSSETVSLPPIAFAPRLSLGALALPAVLFVALAIRVWVFWTHTYIIFVDETFQYLEQGHRLAFGSGVVPWEFQDGDRSWLLPGVIAGLMRLSSLLSDEPLVYVRLIRLLCVALSLVPVWVGFRIGQLRDGVLGALLTGGLCAIWFDLIYFAPAVLTEVLAAHCIILTIFLSMQTGWQAPRRLLLLGGLCGLVFCLRYQYVPALLAAGLWQYRLSWPNWRWLLAGCAAVVLPLAGGLDWLTWGTPFQSIWLNLLRNSFQGVSAGMGVEPASFYPAYLKFALQPLPILAALAILGAVRMPALALAATVTLLEHMLVPHKEVRFIYLTIAAAPILIGLGLVEVICDLRRRLDRRFAAASAATFLLASACLSWWTATETLGPRWQSERSYTLAFLAAGREPGICGLAVRDVWFWLSGGYTYLHRDVPIWFGWAEREPGLALPGTDQPLHMMVINHGRPVQQFAEKQLGAETAHFSHMIAYRDDAEPGYTQLACFNDAARRAGEPDMCLYRRPGGCS